MHSFRTIAVTVAVLPLLTPPLAWPKEPARFHAGTKFSLNDGVDGSQNSSSSEEGSQDSGWSFRKTEKVKGGGVVTLDAEGDPSVCYNLRFTNPDAIPADYESFFIVPTAPIPGATTASAALTVELIDANGDGKASIEPTFGITIQKSSVGGGAFGTSLGVDLGPAIRNPGTYTYTIGPKPGPAGPSGGDISMVVNFALSAKDTVILKGKAIQDDGSGRPSCTIPISADGPPGMAKAQQSCANGTGKQRAKQIATSEKALLGCLQAVAKNPGGASPLLTCVAADAKVQAAADASTASFATQCTGVDKQGIAKLGAVGAHDPSLPATHDAVLNVAPALAIATFGTPVDPPVTALAGDKAGAKCQQAVAKSVNACFDARLHQYDDCKKTRLKHGSATGHHLAVCLTRDPKRKMATACDDAAKPDGIRKALAKSCLDKGVSLAAAFPSCGAGGDVESTHACIASKIPCLTCRTVFVTDDFRGVSCDKFDDKQLNASCSSPM